MTRLSVSGAALGLSLLAITAFAHGGATGIVKERMDGMMAMGKALGTIADMFKGKTTYDPKGVEQAALVVGQHAAKMNGLFPDTPKSRNGKGTEALPAIWERPEDFARLVKQLEDRSATLATLARSGERDDVKAGFRDLLKTCSQCHRDFRKAGG